MQPETYLLHHPSTSISYSGWVKKITEVLVGMPVLVLLVTLSPIHAQRRLLTKAINEMVIDQAILAVDKNGMYFMELQINKYPLLKFLY